MKNNGLGFLLNLQKRPTKYPARNKMPSCEDNKLVTLIDLYVIRLLLDENYTLKSILKAISISDANYHYYKHKLLNSSKNDKHIELSYGEQAQANPLYQKIKAKLSNTDIKLEQQPSVTLLDLYVIQRLVDERYFLKRVLKAMSINGPTYYKHRNRNSLPIELDSSDELQANNL